MGTVVFLVGLALIGLFAMKAIGKVKPEQLVVKAVKAFVGLLVLTSLASAIIIVPAGHRVVVFNRFTGVKLGALGEGMHAIIPFVESPISFDVRVQKADIKASAASKDLQDVTTEVVLNFHPLPAMMPKIYQQYGADYEDKVVSPAVQEVVKAVVATYTAEQIITKREELKGKIQQQLADMIKEANLELVETYMTNFNFSQGFSQAIESKQIAEQNALRANRDLERIKIEAEQKIASARAEAESLKMQKEAITPQLIELRKVEASIKAIDKWNGILPTTILGDKAVPFLNLANVGSK